MKLKDILDYLEKRLDAIPGDKYLENREILVEHGRRMAFQETYKFIKPYVIENYPTDKTPNPCFLCGSTDVIRGGDGMTFCDRCTASASNSDWDEPR